VVCSVCQLLCVQVYSLTICASVPTAPYNAITGMRILFVAAKQGPNNLSFMSSRTKHILFISAMNAVTGMAILAADASRGPNALLRHRT
jgi:hypothetical protein